MKHKCKRCNVFYDTQNPYDMGLVCARHAGLFTDFLVKFGPERYGRWSCCAESLHSAPGCAKGKHEIDEATDKILNSFNYIPTGSSPPSTPGNPTTPGYPTLPSTATFPSTLPNAILNPNITSNTKSALVPTPNPNFTTPGMKPEISDNYILYEVQFGDTLAGIAIRHHTNAGKLKQLNRLMTHNEVHTRKTILIPKSTLAPLTPPPSLPLSSSLSYKQNCINLVMEKTNVAREEAQFYLEENNWVVNHAVAEISQDVEWEKDDKDEKEGRREDEREEEEMIRRNNGCFSWLAPQQETKILLRSI